MTPELERQLRASLRAQIAQLTPPQHVDEIVDLAFHAANSAISTVHAVAERASSHKVMVAVLGPAFGLVAAEAEARIQGLLAYAEQNGLASTVFSTSAGQ